LGLDWKPNISKFQPNRLCLSLLISVTRAVFMNSCCRFVDPRFAWFRIAPGSRVIRAGAAVAFRELGDTDFSLQALGKRETAAILGSAIGWTGTVEIL
jgi:hypothetical protein